MVNVQNIEDNCQLQFEDYHSLCHVPEANMAVIFMSLFYLSIFHKMSSNMLASKLKLIP